MLTQTKTPKQGLLFSEPSIAETGVWCELKEGINPEEWAVLCRYIGNMNPKQFRKAKNPDSLKSRFKRLFTFDGSKVVEIPALSLGPSGINGQFQREQ